MSQLLLLSHQPANRAISRQPSANGPGWLARHGDGYVARTPLACPQLFEAHDRITQDYAVLSCGM